MKDNERKCVFCGRKFTLTDGQILAEHAIGELGCCEKCIKKIQKELNAEYEKNRKEIEKRKQK